MRSCTLAPPTPLASLLSLQASATLIVITMVVRTTLSFGRLQRSMRRVLYKDTSNTQCRAWTVMLDGRQMASPFVASKINPSFFLILPILESYHTIRWVPIWQNGRGENRGVFKLPITITSFDLSTIKTIARIQWLLNVTSSGIPPQVDSSK